MGFCAFVGRFLRKGKYFVLVLLCLSVLAWIANFSGEIAKSMQVSLNVTQIPVNSIQYSFIDPSRRNSKEGNSKADNLRDHLNQRLSSKHAVTPLPQVKCPQTSPLLRGAVKLSFEPSLTLKDVENDNKGVTEGKYAPTDCKARQSVAILIPHRNREKHLLYLLHHLHPFLQRQQIHYGIYVIQQAGDATFNRAKLLNVGYLEALKEYSWECFILHDVDLVPENDHNLYVCDKQPKHLVVGRNATGYKLRYKGYFGGVTAMTQNQFSQVNGFSNSYWGWGGEDDDLRIRVQLQKLTVVRPPAHVARYTMVFHKRDSGNEANKDRMQLLRQTQQVWRKDGLNSCSYKTLSIERLPLYVNITVDIGKP